MEILKGKTILIGKEPGRGRLVVSVEKKTTVIGLDGCVPASVSRCLPAEGIGHCCIEIKSDGSMIVKNLKAQNITCVDGVEIIQKKVTTGSSITLGTDHHPINLVQILESARDLVLEAKTSPLADKSKESPTYSLKSLESVWEGYEKDILDMQIEQAKKGNQQKLQGILSLCATVCAFVEFLGPIRFVILGLALLCAIIFFYQGSKTGELFAVKKNERDKKLQKDYVCPNPSCRSFKGNIPYVQLKNYKGCPVCDCKYIL